MDTKEISESTKEKEIPKCGIVMPISAIDNCTVEHWTEVLSIIKESISSAGFEPFLVSDADESGIIQKRIVHNLYSNEIIVCDVSAKNPNVMFELGMRLAFDKPTIIIKDDKTEYTFDTSIIEHLTYPRDLRFNRIINFKEGLKKKIMATYEKSKNDPNYTTFLKHFGEYKVANLSEKEVTSEKYIISAIEDLRHEMILLRRNQRNLNSTPSKFSISNALISKKDLVNNLIEDFKNINDIEDNFTLLISDKRDDLIKMLTLNNQIRNTFANQSDLEKIVDDILSQ